MKLAIVSLIAVTLALTGCGSLFGARVKPIEIMSKPIERMPLNLAQPTPLKLKKIEWIVVTPNNVDSVFEKLANEKQNQVLFAVTDQGYMELAMTMMEIRNFISTQRQVIVQYKQYYEPPRLPDPAAK
jgi:outer membrane lipopolysaccharide assembly protein LptE/RlpB